MILSQEVMVRQAHHDTYFIFQMSRINNFENIIMSNFVSKISETLASDVWFDPDLLHIRLLDGRELSVPLEWFPKLRNATDKQREKWRLIGRGIGIHWDELDEDISIPALLK